MKVSKGHLLCLALLGPVFSACAKSEAPAPAPSASAASRSTNPNVDGDLLSQLETIAKSCKVDTKVGSVSCPKGEQRSLTSEFVSNKRPREKAILTFATALKDEKNAELRVVAANVLSGAFRSPWSSVKPGAVKPEDANALVNAVVGLPPAQARQAMPAAVHAAMLSGQSAALYAALDKSKDPEARVTAARYLMTHGRLDAFPKIQELSKDENQAVALSALESPRSMFNWTAEEQAAICPWAVELLSDKRAPIAAKSASLLGNCSGEFIDKLLDIGEASLKDGQFSAQHVAGYRDLCSPSRRSKKNSATEDQCKRSRKLLEAVVDNKKADAQTRGMALLAIAYQWPDDGTLKLAKRLEKSDEKTLAEHAKRTVQRLEQKDKGGSALAQKLMAKPGSPVMAPGGSQPAAHAPAAPAPEVVRKPLAP